MSIDSFGRCSFIAVAIILCSSPALAQFSATAGSKGNNDSGEVDWMADANIGALRLQDADLQAAGDLSFGIGQDWWGFSAWGSGSAYQIENDEVLNDTTKLEGKGDAWMTLGEEPDVLRLVLRASGGGVNYSSTVFKKTNAIFTDDDSWMGRGSLFIGGVFRPAPSFSAYFALGGGVQYEWYDTTSTVAATYAIDDTQDLSFVGNGRFDASWIIAREVVSLRIRALGTYFKLSRDNDFLGGSVGVTTQQSTSTSFSQLEVSSRGFIDIDAASFFGFRPTLHGGLDYVRVSGDGETQSTSIPEFGAGLLRPWM